MRVGRGSRGHRRASSYWRNERSHQKSSQIVQVHPKTSEFIAMWALIPSSDLSEQDKVKIGNSSLVRWIVYHLFLLFIELFIASPEWNIYAVFTVSVYLFRVFFSPRSFSSSLVPVIEFIVSTRAATSARLNLKQIDAEYDRNICMLLCGLSPSVGVLEAICSFIFPPEIRNRFIEVRQSCRVWIRQCSTLRTSFSLIKVNFPKRRKSDSQFMN